MILSDCMDEAAGVLSEITGLRTFAWPPPTISPPAGIVSYPDSIEYDTTYGRGVDRFLGMPLIVVFGKATDRAARNKVAAWASGSGEQSVKAAFESHQWNSCDDCVVTKCSFDVVTISGADYLAAMFEADLIGGGA